MSAQKLRKWMMSKISQINGDDGNALVSASIDLGQRIEFANKLRGIAAVSVVFYHYAMFWYYPWASRLWGNLPDVVPVKSSWLPFLYQFPVQRPPAYLPTIDWGAFGVALFFLLSGFVIANSARSYSAKDFLLNRVLRIYPTYAVGFVFVLAAHAVAGWNYGRGLPYSGARMVAHSFPGIRQFVDALFVDASYIDPIIWTLEVEIKFYLVVFVLILMRQSGVNLRATSVGTGIGVLTVLLCLLVPVTAVSMWQLLSDAQFVCFILIGTVFFQHWNADISRFELMKNAGVLFFLFALAWAISDQRGMSGQFIGRIWSYLAAIAVFVTAMRFSSLFVRPRGIVNFYSEISYPLYVVHLGTGYLVMSLIKDYLGLPLAVNIALAFGASTLTAWVLHMAVELPTMRMARIYRARHRLNPLNQSNSQAR
ncbi:acyltransferase family protein [Bradyrhizobium tunisiense]|uniref:acyltransferase family protein n=1 Tax=Bradyrhizobium tunisiense TaxID=3278709 RepID=UPI0035D93D0E